jgi:polyferredoxin
VRNLRRLSQVLFLLVFVFLFMRTEYGGTNELQYPVKVFLDFDPLNGLSSLLASRSLPSNWFFALATLLVTAVLGRFFCGWVCPFGTLHHALSYTRKKIEKGREKWLPAQRVKYLVLAAVLVTAGLSLQMTGVADPLSLLIRSLGLGINPAYNEIGHLVFDLIYRSDIRPLTRVSESVFAFLRSHHILSFQVPHFSQAFFLSVLFLGILSLNFLRKRFWCRYLCPLGAMLGLASRLSFLRLHTSTETCNECRRCVKDCPAEADPFPAGHWKVSECFTCWNCVENCDRSAVKFRFGRPKLRLAAPEKIDLGRRRLILTGVAAAAAVPLYRGGAVMKRTRSPLLIRPPGAEEEKRFLEKCVRCSECMKVCLTNVIQPAFLEAGLEGIWTPLLSMRRGYCEFSCTLCGQVCPTQAIRRLGVEEKQKVKIGLAFIDTARCLPYAFGTECIVCEEHCPTPKKAIWFQETEVRLRDGSTRRLKQPRVDPDLCIGCGICEYRCPVVDRPAVYCTSVGESRSRDNQLILSSYGGGG